MKDIKSLYLAAKSSGKQADISAYTEAIQDLIDNNPYSYMTQLEYIISSDIGLKTVKPFIEKNGFPIACYDKMIESLNECIRKCEVYGKDNSLYTEMVEYFETFRADHINCFMMFENYNLELDESYTRIYFGKNDKGISNRKNISGMIKKFSEAAIPDALITAESINEDAVYKVLEFVDNSFLDNENCATIYEWVLTACNDIPYGESTEEIINHMEENCLSAIVEKVKNREHQLFRESMIMGRDDLMMEYSEDEVNAIQELIAFKEYQMLWADEVFEEKSTTEVQSEIYSLYEMIDGIEDNDSMNEAMWIANTRNKKTGEIPGYLARNHDLSYGEDDTANKKISVEELSGKEPTLDDYKRPSATKDKENDEPVSSGQQLHLPSAFNSDNDDKPSTTSPNSTGLSDHDKSIINNYYYNYTNSHNKNMNSFNKDSSLKDDHSTNDDHSSVSHNGSHNKREYKLIPDDKKDDNIDTKPTNESSNPWELNIFDPNGVTKDNFFNESLVLEAVGDADLNKPKSDHPVKDILTDIDRKTAKKHQEAKKRAQEIQNTGRALMKPVNRTKSLIANTLYDWKDKDENSMKEKMTDPRARSKLFTAIRELIIGGSLLKAGVLLNPVFAILAGLRGINKHNQKFRLRNEIIGELKAELEIIDEKIKDADERHDKDAKYKLMRFKNELNKKLIRVGGTKAMSKMI